MGLTKYASFEVSDVLDIKSAPARSKTASLKTFSDFHDYRTDDGYLYVRIRAISSRVNKNHDGWPSIELAGGNDAWERISSQHQSSDGGFTVEANNDSYGFSTFIGKPIFVDHNNSDPKRARGVIVDSKFNVLDHKTAAENDDYWSAPDKMDKEHNPPCEVELLLEVDAESFPKFAKAIVNGDLDGFSMGADVDYSKCSHCGQKASSPDEYCSHIQMKGAEHSYTSSDGTRTSKKSYENCYGVKFFEISGVFDPADETALTKEVRASVNKEAVGEKPMRCPTCSGTGRTDPEVPCHSCHGSGMLQVQENTDGNLMLDSDQGHVGQPISPDSVTTEGPMIREPHGALVSPHLTISPEELRRRMPNLPTTPRQGSYLANRKTAQPEEPHSMHTVAPEDVNTLRQEQVCPLCGSDMDHEKCDVCFTPDTLVRTRDGYVPISTVEVGDYVLSKSGVFNRVYEVHENEYNGLLLEIQTRSTIDPIRVTPEHPFLALDATHISKQKRCLPGRCNRTINHPKSKTKHEIGWVEAQNLSEGGWISTNVPTQRFDRGSIPVPEEHLGRKDRRGPSEFELSSEFLWAVGLYIAEGSAGTRKITYALHRDEAEYQERLRLLFESLGYTVSLELRKNKPNSAWVHINSSTLSDWFPAWLGSSSHNKHIPAEILDLPDEKVGHVFRGILDGDGHNIRNQLGQTSPMLALQVSELSMRRGGTPTTQIERPENKKVVYQVNGTTAVSVESKHKDKRGTWKIKDRLLTEIKSIKQVPYWGKVYNLSVENDASYTVQNLAVHNCGYEEPPEQLQNPDLTKAQGEDPEKLDSGEQEEAFEEEGHAPNQNVQDGSYLKTRNNQPTASVISDMRWEPKGIDKTKLASAPKPQGDEPEETVVSDQATPVTAAFRTAKDMIEAAKRNQEKNNMSNQNKKVAADPADPSGKAKKRVDVEGVGGVDDASAEAASKPDAKTDVEGKGGIIQDSNQEASKENTSVESLPSGEQDNAGFQDGGQTGDSTKTFPNTNEPDSAVTDKASAKKGTDPADPVGKADDRIDVEQAPHDRVGPGTDQWTGTGGNGVTRQQDPVTNVPTKSNGITSKTVSLAALKLADTEVELGIIPASDKYNRLAELSKLDDEQVVAEHRAIARVKKAGLSRTASNGGVGRLPQFNKIARDERSAPQPVNDGLLDSALFG